MLGHTVLESVLGYGQAELAKTAADMVKQNWNRPNPGFNLLCGRIRVWSCVHFWEGWKEGRRETPVQLSSVLGRNPSSVQFSSGKEPQFSSVQFSSVLGSSVQFSSVQLSFSFRIRICIAPTRLDADHACCCPQ
jgi:hypothetical protein